MSAAGWSYLLAAVGILGIWLAGRKNLWGWAIGLGAQLLWIVYALATNQPGFIVSAVAYGIVYGRNWARWNAEAPPRRHGRRRAEPPELSFAEFKAAFEGSRAPIAGSAPAVAKTPKAMPKRGPDRPHTPQHWNGKITR